MTAEALIQQLVEEIRKAYVEKGRLASGGFGRSLEVRSPQPDVWQVWGAHYARYMVKGRRPGGMPPVDVIREWIRVKPGLPATMKADAERLAWAIAISIGKRGIRVPNQFYKGDFLDVAFERWRLKNKDVLPQVFGADWLRKVRSELLRTLKQS